MSVVSRDRTEKCDVALVAPRFAVGHTVEDAERHGVMHQLEAGVAGGHHLFR
jgi:hypothetical protein